MKKNPVGWFEIYVKDMTRSRAFYEGVLATKLAALESPDSSEELTMFAFPMEENASGAPGALVSMKGEQPSGNGTIVYFTGEDRAVEANRVPGNGGTIMKDKFSIGPYGFIALVTDLDGNVVRLHSMKQRKAIRLFVRGADGGVHPGADRLAIRLGEFRLRVQPVVAEQRHAFLAKHFADVLQVAPTGKGRFAGFEPFGKIEMLAAVDHVIAYGPGDRRYVGIPGPFRFVGVAVGAGAGKDILNGARRLHHDGKGARRISSGIGFGGGGEELNEDREGGDGNEYVLLHRKRADRVGPPFLDCTSA